MTVAQRSYLRVMAAAVCYGMTTPLARGFMDGDFHPVALAGTFYLGAGLGLTLLGLLVRRPPEAALTRADTSLVLLGILFGGLLGPVLILLGVARSSGLIGSLSLNLEAPFTALLAVFFFGERIGRHVVAGGLLIIAGAAALAWNPGAAVDSRDSVAGILLIAAGCVCWALDNNITRRVAGKDPLRIAQIRGLVSGPVILAVAAWWSPGALAPLQTTDGLLALALGSTGYGLSLVLYVRALRDLGAARVGTLFATAPFIGVVVAMIVLDDRPTPAVAVAGVLMLIGVYVITRERAVA